MLGLGALFLSACGGLESAGVSDLSSKDPFCRVRTFALASTQKLQGYSTDQKIIALELAESQTFSPLSKERTYMALYDHKCLNEAPEKRAGALFKSSIQKGKQRYRALEVMVGDNDIHGLRDQLLKDPCLVAFVPNVRLSAGDFSVEVQVDTSGEPRLSEQLHLSELGAIDLWDFVYSNRFYSEKITVGVVDTGINFNHEDLTARAPGGAGQNFINMSLDANDDNGHGTHVAGLIGADGTNGLGGSGIAPDGVELMSLKALDSGGGGDISAVINAINFAVDNGAQVINMSLGTAGAISVLKATIEEVVNRGVFVVAAAGNDGIEITQENGFSPAMYAKDIDGFLSVGSVDAVGGFHSSFSNYSASYVEILAPGAQTATVGLLSTAGVGSLGPYVRLLGTSMAAPLVSGTVAMVYRVLKERGVDPRPAEVEALIRRYSRVVPGLSLFGVDGKTLDLKFLAEGLKQELGQETCL